MPAPIRSFVSHSDPFHWAVLLPDLAPAISSRMQRHFSASHHAALTFQANQVERVEHFTWSCATLAGGPQCHRQLPVGQDQPCDVRANIDRSATPFTPDRIGRLLQIPGDPFGESDPVASLARRLGIAPVPIRPWRFPRASSSAERNTSPSGPNPRTAVSACCGRHLFGQFQFHHFARPRPLPPPAAAGKWIRGFGWKPSLRLSLRPARRNRRVNTRIRSRWPMKRRSPSLLKRRRMRFRIIARSCHGFDRRRQASFAVPCRAQSRGRLSKGQLGYNLVQLLFQVHLHITCTFHRQRPLCHGLA